MIRFSLFLLLLPALAAAQTPLATWSVNQTTLTVQRTGAFALSDASGPYVTQAGMSLFGPNWNGTQQTSAEVVQASATVDEATIQARLTESASKQPWELRQTVKRTAEGWDFRYRLTPQAAMPMNEVSLVLDLPIKRFSGQTVVLWPQEERALPPTLPAEHHFVRADAERYAFAAGRPDQLTLTLDQVRLCNVQDARAFQGDSYQAFVKLLDTARTVKAGETFDLAFTLRPRDPKDWRAAKLSLTSQAPLALGEVKADPTKVGERGTLHVGLTGTWDTPFWQEQIALDAAITAPDGTERRVPGCFVQPYNRTVPAGRTAERLTVSGAAEWQVRWLPRMAGEHRIRLTARDRSGTVEKTLTVPVAAGAERPFVRVSSTDRHYFEFGNGQPYFANGLNVCWYQGAGGTTDYDTWFGALAANGGNYVRVWMPPWAFGFEWGKPGSYKQDRCQQFDYVVDLAQAKGIFMKVCLEFFRTFDDANPYAKANGGPCASVLEVFTNADAKRMWRNRLRYCVARWGWSPNIMAWEQWNEINCIQGYQEAPVQAWAREMCSYLKSINPDHLTTNSLGSFVFEPELWKSPEIDFAQEHGYWHPTWTSREFGKDMAQMMVDRVKQIRVFDKPCFFAEFGLVNETWGPSPRMADDSTGVNLHNGMWGAMMAGAAGTGHLWWWDSYVAPQNLWFHYKGVAKFIEGVPWNTAGFEPSELGSASPGLRVLALKGKGLTLLWAQNRAHTWWNVAEKKPIEPVKAATVTLPGLTGKHVELWDPWTGARLCEATAASDSLELGEVARDVAIKVTGP